MAVTTAVLSMYRKNGTFSMTYVKFSNCIFSGQKTSWLPMTSASVFSEVESIQKSGKIIMTVIVSARRKRIACPTRRATLCCCL